MDQNACPRGLGVIAVDNKVYLYLNRADDSATLLLQTSGDGINFSAHKDKPLIIDNKKRVQNTGNCSDFRISHVNNSYILAYKLKHLSSPQLRFARSNDLVNWNRMGSVSSIREAGMVVPEYTRNSNYVLYFGDGDLKLAYSNDLLTWQIEKATILSPRSNYFDAHPLSVAAIRLTEKGIAVLYYCRERRTGKDHFDLGMALFDSNNPAKLIWRSENPLVTHSEDFGGKVAVPVGVVEIDDTLISYWNLDCEGVVAAVHPKSQTTAKAGQKGIGLTLGRLAQNPILKPIAHHFWESKQVFNPAAVYEAGRVHLVYRAIGDNDTSMLGYAATSDGINIDDRSKAPAYVPSLPFEHNPFAVKSAYSPYLSGGGAYGGSEDPRITKIDDRMYMTYIAYDGGPPRVALTSISVDDFLNHRWNWERPVLISPPGVVDKNACILPEKIDGKYCIFHRIYPHILIDFVENLEFDGKRYLKGEYRIGPRRKYWDSRKVGIGPTPLKTKAGWLVIYHAVGEQEPGKYKMGAMLLDTSDPTRVVVRSRNPILEPEVWYENEGFKPGVAYPCGSAIVDETLYVYYGAADQVVCAAKSNLRLFLGDLQHEQKARLNRVQLSI